MSLVDQHIPSRESIHSNATSGEVDVDGRLDLQKLSYRESSSLSDAPRSLYSDDNDDHDATSYDDNIMNEYYDDMIEHDSKKGLEADAGPAPALPAKSSLRASRLLDAFHPVKLDIEETTALSKPIPQDMYLSSEEDASSSADEFSDYDFESDNEESGDKGPKTRRSHEITAKMVSVVFVGKPSMIELSGGRRATSPQSSQQRVRPQSRFGPSSTEPLLRRLSVSSSRTTTSVQTAPNDSSRFSTKPASLLARPRPSFLTIDPYASKSYHEKVEEEGEQGRPSCDGKQHPDAPITPKTPTAMFRRGLSIMRKRSKPHLKQESGDSRDTMVSTSTSALPVGLPTDEERGRSSVVVSYSADALSAVKRASTMNSLSLTPVSPAGSSAQSPATPNGVGKNKILSSFHRRRRSIKA